VKFFLSFGIDLSKKIPTPWYLLNRQYDLPKHRSKQNEIL